MAVSPESMHDEISTTEFCPERTGGVLPDADLFIEEMDRRWRAGERPLAENYLNRSPDLWDKPDDALEIIYEEISLRHQHGDPAELDDFLLRFPQWSEQLRVLFNCHDLLGSDSGAASPGGEGRLQDFQTVAELGQGASGRVVLATETSLADRPTVLKLVSADRQEHLSLARLQHTNIVPLYGTFADDARGLRVLCMPYFGGGTLDRIWARLRLRPPSLRTGGALVDALEEVHKGVGDTRGIVVGGPVCELLARSSYTRAICWIGACLAEALQYAHERGLVHLDVKPSNILVAADGQPMLLDFHLARAPIPANGPPPLLLGGTPAYMAPEQRLMVDALRSRIAVRQAIDGRADIYALALVLYEALGGSLQAGTNRPVRPLHRINNQVGVGLSDVIAKCLSAAPGDRYPTAGALADDLRRHLSDLPLRGVRNRSLRERWSRWRRRRPFAIALGALAAGVIVIGGLLGLQVASRLNKATEALQEGKDYLAKRQFVDAKGCLRRGLAFAEGLPFGQQVCADLRNGLQLVEQGRLTQNLTAVMDEVRFRSGGDFSSAAELHALEAQCRSLWENRGRILNYLRQEMDPSSSDQLQTDFVDLGVLLSDLSIRAARTGELRLAHEEAVEILNEAEKEFRPSLLLSLERQRHNHALGRIEEVRADQQRSSGLSPQSAWEFYALARSHLQAGRPDLAADEVERSLDLQPHSFWGHFLKGQTACRVGKFEDAIAAFTTCVALRPEAGWCYYNRGVAYTGAKQIDRAVREFDQALRRDRTLAAAYLNRGVLQYQRKRVAEARSDFRQALTYGSDAATVHCNLALVEASAGNISDARENLKLALEHDPHSKEAQALLSRLGAPPE
jgi:serine/threonine protein kinase/Tfp pilus assembly protein PilF